MTRRTQLKDCHEVPSSVAKYAKVSHVETHFTILKMMRLCDRHPFSRNSLGTPRAILKDIATPTSSGKSSKRISSIRGGRGAAETCTGPTRPKMVKMTSLVEMALFRTGFQHSRDQVSKDQKGFHKRGIHDQGHF